MTEKSKTTLKDAVRIIVISILVSCLTLIIQSFITSPRTNEKGIRDNLEAIRTNSVRIEAVEKAQGENTVQLEKLSDKVLTKEEFDRAVALIMKTLNSQ